MIIECVLRHEDAILPSRAHKSDVGYDLTAIRKHKILENGVILYDTGVGVTPPPGYYIEIVSRSSISKTGYMLANGMGIVDPSYTGNLYLALVKVVHGAQEIPLPFTKCQFILRRVYSSQIMEVDCLHPTERGAGGFGSTGSRNAK